MKRPPPDGFVVRCRAGAVVRVAVADSGLNGVAHRGQNRLSSGASLEHVGQRIIA
jgi:hypothetical protein